MTQCVDFAVGAVLHLVHVVHPCGTKYFDDCSLVAKFTNALHDCCLQGNMVVVLACMYG